MTSEGRGDEWTCSYQLLLPREVRCDRVEMRGGGRRGHQLQWGFSLLCVLGIRRRRVQSPPQKSWRTRGRWKAGQGRMAREGQVCWSDSKCTKIRCSRPNGRQKTDIFSDMTNLCFRSFKPAEVC